jgi:hypothetical protein
MNGCNALRVLRWPKAFRLKNGQAASDGEPLHGARARPHAAAGRPVGLRQDQRNVVAGLTQARQRPLGEWRGAGED